MVLNQPCYFISIFPDFFKISIVQPVITSCKIAQLIDQQCVVYNFKCDLNAMLVMSDTPVAICLYALMDIEERPYQCANTMIIETQAGFWMTFATVLMC